MTVRRSGLIRQPALLAAAVLLSMRLAPQAQSPSPQGVSSAEMGVVATRDVRLTGGMDVDGPVAKLMNNVGVTAQDRDVPIALSRGGHVLVCTTSEFHLLRSGRNGALIFGLDRGAVEIGSESHAQDAVLTPDLKFVPVTSGPLDLRVRVTREGDTCVDNAGANAPVLNATDPFSSASYRVLPGQHLLFIKGDLHQVVDHERSPCGCPSSTLLQMAGRNGKPLTPAQAAATAAHPFPQAQSEGLAPAAEASNAAPAGTASSQVTTSFNYGEGIGRPPSVADTPPEKPAATDRKGGFFHAIGHFFHRLFGGS